jgi:hypothetical protein
MTQSKAIFNNICSDKEKRTHNRRFGNMAGRRIYAQLFVRYSASVPADE